jgi:AbrB family looped-hinge helix DNA binding protein
MIAHVSNKGQITLPSAIRQKLGIVPDSNVEVIARDDEVVIRPLRSIAELRGAFRHCVGDEPMDWEQVRSAAERAVAEEVNRE